MKKMPLKVALLDNICYKITYHQTKMMLGIKNQMHNRTLKIVKRR